MTKPIGTPVTVTIVAVDPPFDREHGVLFGLQSKRGVDDPVQTSKTTEFRAEIEVRTGDDGFDFAGDHAHGRRGDRFDNSPKASAAAPPSSGQWWWVPDDGRG